MPSPSEQTEDLKVELKLNKPSYKLKEIWRWSADKVFAQVITEFSIAPGKSKSFEEVWEQVDNEGKGVSAGKYQIIGILATSPERSSQAVSVEIWSAS